MSESGGHMKRKHLNSFTLFALFFAIVLVLQMTPFGFLRIGPIAITFIHIPVIVITILLGWKYGVALGFIFGLCSVINNTVAPSITSFCFSPFVSIGGVNGNFYSLIIAFIPRMLIGISTYYSYLVLKSKVPSSMAFSISAMFSTILHSIMVLSLIYLFFGVSYASAKGVAYEQLVNVLLGVIGTNGVVEAIASAILVPAICKAMMTITKQPNK